MCARVEGGVRRRGGRARREGVKRRRRPLRGRCKQSSLSLSCLAAARSRSPEPGAVTRSAPDRGELAAPGSAPHGHSEGAPRPGGCAAAGGGPGGRGGRAALRAAPSGPGRSGARGDGGRGPRGPPRCCRKGRRLGAGGLGAEAT